jgi:hypothetical protein
MTRSRIKPVDVSLYGIAGSMFANPVLPGDIRCYNNVDDAKRTPGKF